MSRRTHCVAFLAKSLPQYRVAFFSLLRQRLAESGIEVRVIYGDAAPAEAARRDGGELSWAEFKPNRFFNVGRRTLIWQPVVSTAREVDLVVVEQATRLLANYVLLAMQAFGSPKVAFWGHGANLQEDSASRAGEAVKRLVSRHPHWWFAYTDGSRARVMRLGYPSERITVVQNAIDTRAAAAVASSIDDDEIAAFRARHLLGDGPIGTFVGALYEDKRLPFLFAAADEVVRTRPDFRLVIMGEGPEREFVRSACSYRPWVRWLHAQFQREKAIALAASRVFLLPSLVGLAILDAFAVGVPLVTTASDFHGPEIEYLDPGVNGVLVGDAANSQAYAAAIIELLHDDLLHSHLVAGCARSASCYTNEAMVQRFTAGVVGALEAAA
jgi:glycosyltransferase involved in cell wall biosynthesis